MRRALLVTVLLLAASATSAGSALAGSYQVSACAGATPLVNNSWQPFNSNTAYLETSSNCGSADVTGNGSTTSGLAAADILKLTTNVPSGALAGWQFTAPSGDAISAISMDRDLYEEAEGWVPQVVDAGGNPLLGETCPFNGNNGGCEVSGPESHTGLDTASLAIELLCHPEPFQLSACPNGFSQHVARVELNSATVTVTDEQPPQIASLGGSLFAGGLVHGTLSGTIEGSDSSGVQYARVYVDGTQAVQRTSSCDFTQPAPCPASVSDQLSLDTRTLSDGPHQIQAALLDAAGNETRTSAVQVTVENTPPGAPTGLQVNGRTGGAWINQPATIAWANPSQPSQNPIGQVNWIACAGTQTSIPASGCDAQQHQASPLSSLTFNPAQDPAFAGQPQGVYTVFVWLADALGNSTQANSAAIVFGVQTSPPPPPRSIAARGSGPYTITLGAPAHLAPLTATHWIACNGKGACTPTQTSPGLSFEFDPNHTPSFQRSPYGRYEIRAWLEDAAGNTSPADSATLFLTHRRHTQADPRLRILSVRLSRRELHVRGSAARALSGHLTVVVHYKLGTRSRSVAKTVRVVRGRWAAVLGLPRRSHALSVTVVHHRTSRWRAQSVTRRV